MPIFKFLTNALFPPIDARHITHWARADSENNASTKATTIAVTMERVMDFRSWLSILKILMAFGGWLGRALVPQVPGAETVREKHQQHKADANDQRRNNCQHQIQALESQVHKVSHD